MVRVIIAAAWWDNGIVVSAICLAELSTMTVYQFLMRKRNHRLKNKNYESLFSHSSLLPSTTHILFFNLLLWVIEKILITDSKKVVFKIKYVNYLSP